MKVVIVYGTTEGQTRKIARFMEDVLQDAGHKVAIADASDEPPGARRLRRYFDRRIDTYT